MKLPRLRHIEYLILKTIEKTPKTREQIQKELRWNLSNNYFYQNMITMERKGYIKRQWMIEDKPFRYFLVYKIINIAVIKQSKEFYR